MCVLSLLLHVWRVLWEAAYDVVWRGLFFLTFLKFISCSQLSASVLSSNQRHYSQTLFSVTCVYRLTNRFTLGLNDSHDGSVPLSMYDRIFLVECSHHWYTCDIPAWTCQNVCCATSPFPHTDCRHPITDPHVLLYYYLIYTRLGGLCFPLAGMCACSEKRTKRWANISDSLKDQHSLRTKNEPHWSNQCLSIYCKKVLFVRHNQ